MRFALAAIVALCCIVVVRVNALAEVEYCPALIEGAHSFGQADPGVYSFELSGESQRTVSGDIVAQTNVGWFTFPFSNVALVPDTAKYTNDYADFERTKYVSQPIFAQFPSEVLTIERLFVEDAKASGDATYKWDAHGRVNCPPPSGMLYPQRQLGPFGDDAKRDTPLLVDLTRLPAARDTPITAALTSAPGSVDCPTPFASAEVNNTVAPNWPPGNSLFIKITVLIAVAVSTDGRLDDAWIYQPSGRFEFDQEALKAARASTYKPGAAFCQPAPGLYLFRAEFSRD